MSYALAVVTAFQTDLTKASKKVQLAYTKTGLSRLKDFPETADPPRIRKIRDFKQLWRYKIGKDWRLVYRVQPTERLVTLLMLDHKERIYKRLGTTPQGPVLHLVANSPHLLEPELVTEAKQTAALTSLALNPPPHDDHHPDEALPVTLTRTLLSDWGVDEQFHNELLTATTESELLALNSTIGDHPVTQVLNGLFPPTLETTSSEPVRVLPDTDTIIDELAEGNPGTLHSLLLKLDTAQKDFVSRVEKGRGPWLLKGGPGSGKSTVALYCVQSVVHRERSRLPGVSAPPQILFTTYTHSLTSAAESLANALDCHNDDVKIINIDGFADELLDETPGSPPGRRLQIDPYVSRALETLENRVAGRLLFSVDDKKFLGEEITTVIYGRELRTKQEYLDADRSGRGRALLPKQREQVWSIYTKVDHDLQRDNNCTLPQAHTRAREFIENSPRYDYVFIDEAQDLSPSAIRLCIAACKTKNIFLTADTNQSIYPTRLSWPQITAALNFTGRTRILKTNHRTTKQLSEALKQLVPTEDVLDTDTAYDTPHRFGPPPTLYFYNNDTEQIRCIHDYLHTALMEDKLTYSCAAILCATHKVGERLESALDPALNPRFMPSRELDPDHQGVTITTMHAAKGLEFPVVVVAAVEDGIVPWKARSTEDKEDHEAQFRRLFYVACSRSMNRLLVLASRYNPSPFVKPLTEEHWNIENATTQPN